MAAPLAVCNDPSSIDSFSSVVSVTREHSGVSTTDTRDDTYATNSYINSGLSAAAPHQKCVSLITCEDPISPLTQRSLPTAQAANLRGFDAAKGTLSILGRFLIFVGSPLGGVRLSAWLRFPHVCSLFCTVITHQATVVGSLISGLPVGISNQEQFALRIGCEGTDSKREGRALCRQASSRLKRGGESGKGVRATAMGNDDLPSISVSPTLLLVAEVEETIRFLHKVRTRLPPTAPNARQVRVHTYWYSSSSSSSSVVYRCSRNITRNLLIPVLHILERFSPPLHAACALEQPFHPNKLRWAVGNRCAR